MSQPPFIPTSILRGRDGTNGVNGSNVLPTDVAIAQAVADEDSDTYAALAALIGELGPNFDSDIGPLPAGKGVILVSPNGETIRRISISNDGTVVGADPEFGTGYQAEVLVDDPISYWRLGEASGTAAADETGANNGTYVGGVTLGTAGLVGDADTAITLDGVNDHVVCKTGPIISGLTNWTVEAVVNYTSSGDKALYCERGSSGLDILNVSIGGSQKLKLTYRDHAGTIDEGSSTNSLVTTGTAHHVVVTKAGTAVKFYVDGALDGTLTLTASDVFGEATLQSWIGADATGSQFLDGVIDEVAVYNVALSGARVTAHNAAR